MKGARSDVSREPDILVGLDVGTTKIAVIVAERDVRSQSVRMIGIGSEPSQGIRKGLIVNLEQAARSVRRAVRMTENMVGFHLSSATVSFSGTGIESVVSSGMVSLGRAAPRPVSENDIERVIEAAQSDVKIPASMFALHTIPVKYSIDGSSGIDDPLGMTGVRLEMELQTVTVPTTVAQNIVNCVESAGINVEGILVKPLASALGALTRDEMDRGAISLCIGGGTTGLAFYLDGKPIKMSVIPIGGDHITNDLAYVFHLPLGEAEALKQKLFTEADDQLTVEGEANRRNPINPDAAIEVISCRLEELLVEHVSPLIAEYGASTFPGGVVLSGGVAKTPGIEVLVSDILKLPARIADPLDYYQMPMGRSDSSYINVTGIVRYVLAKERNPYSFIEAPVSQLGVRGGASSQNYVGAAVRDYRNTKVSNMGAMLDKVKKSLKELF